LKKQQLWLFENGLSEKVPEHGALSDLENEARQAYSELGLDYYEEVV